MTNYSDIVTLVLLAEAWVGEEDFKYCKQIDDDDAAMLT